MLRRVCFVLIGVISAPRAGLSQRQSEAPPPTTQIQRADGSWQQLTPRQHGFNLFANSDLAGTSLKLSGSYRYPAFNAGGLCPFANTAGDLINSSCGQYGGGSTFFHLQTLWGVPPSAYEKIRAVWPGVSNMQSPIGYSTPWRITSLQPDVLRIGPADGQLGSLFSGATSVKDGGCRDMSSAAIGAGVPNNFQLTAASDCPITWAANGFQGMHIIPDSVWLGRFRQNPLAFRFDDWKIPLSEVADQPPIGTLSTYGAFSDFGAETLALYGAVTPRGDPGQAPRERGFPLGIEVRYDAFKFDRKTLRDGVFVRWLVINNSSKVWGTGIDYDSLYMGIDPAYVNPLAAYNVPALGAHIYSGGGISGKCNGNVYPREVLPGAAERCAGVMNHSMHVIMVLKSPIGDLRNKLLSNPASPYFAPANPKADDTITFNHWVRGEFGAQDQFSWRRSDRALFGLMSGREDLWLDGRQATDFTAGQIWTYFRYEFTDGTKSAANLRYNRSVPGSVPGYGKWDYNDDGVQDTLMLPDCGVQGCAKRWSDTIAGGFSNLSAGNVGNYLGVGPFSLKAGDTTEFVWFMGGAPGDTTAADNLIRNVTAEYMGGFNSLLPPAAPTFTAADVQLTSAFARNPVQNTEVRIEIKMPEIRPDVYLSTVVAQLQSNDPAAAEIRRLNPAIVQAVQGRMNQNLARILVFKSCDHGQSWTDASGTCASAATARTTSLGGAPVGFGWQAFRTILADTVSGQLASHVISDLVPAGQEYLYSFVAQSRSLADINVVFQQTTDGGGNITSRKVGTLGDALAIDVDTLSTALRSTGPTTLLVYAPVSVPAGTIAARIDTTTTQGSATNPLSVVARSANVSGRYRMRFGNRFIITRTFDTVSGARTSAVVRQSLYARAANAPSDVAFATNVVAAADTFASNRDFTFSPNSGTTLRATPRLTAGTVQTFVDTIARPGYIIAKASGASDPLYIAVGGNFLNSGSGIQDAIDAYEGASTYPGFTATVASISIFPSSSPSRTIVLRSPTDTLSDSVTRSGAAYVTPAAQNGTGVTILGARSSPGGWYAFNWQGDAFGPGAPFRLDIAVRMQPSVTASLNARPVASVTDTTAVHLTKLIAAISATVVRGRPLVRARLPFTVVGSNGQPATPVMLQRHVSGDVADSLRSNSRLFGTAGDTTRVAIPPDAWMPGDTLYVFENISLDQTATIAGQSVPVLHDTTVNGRAQRLPVQVVQEVLGIAAVLGCAPAGTPSRNTCNPLAPHTAGATAYTTFTSSTVNRVQFNRPFDQNSEVALIASATVAGALPLTKQDMNAIHVVPNPFIVQSNYDRLTNDGVTTSRILFVNVPTEGMLRIYTVSGQLVQQLSWTASDLVASGDNSAHGDLPYNLRNAKGQDLAGGLYIFVLTARGANAKGQMARGKFVVIR